MNGAEFLWDLGVVILLAATAAWLCQRWRLPSALGFLAIGLLAGPWTPFLPLVTDPEQLRSVVHLGLVFVAFSLGLGLRLRPWQRVGVPLMLGTALLAILMFHAGRILADGFGWTAGHGLLFAVILMVSSSTIVSEALRLTHSFHARHGQIALAVARLEHGVAMVLLTVLASLILAGHHGPFPVLGTVVRLNALIVSLMIVALLLAPPLLRWLTRRAPAEVQTLFVLGALLLIALLFVRTGFGAALSGFLLGAVVANTGLAAPLERTLPGLGSVSAAIFLVAAGMLFNLDLFLQSWPLALTLAGVALIGRPLAAAFALVVVGHPTGEAVKSGLSLTAIGEGALILALVAVEGGLAPASLITLTVALGLLTAAVTPLFLRLAPVAGDWVERRQPERGRLWIGFYHRWIERLLRSHPSRRIWSILGPRALQIGVQILVVSGLLVAAVPVHRLVQRSMGPDWPLAGGFTILYWLGFGVLLLAPLVATWRLIDAFAMMCAEVAAPSGTRRATLRPIFQVLLQVVLVGATGLWLATLLPSHLLSGPGAAGVILVLGVIGFGLWRRLIRWHSRLENELRAQLADSPFGWSPAHPGGLPGPRPWWSQAVDVLIRPDARAAGRTIRQLRLRERFGCTLMAIERQGIRLPNPDPDTRLFPNDQLLLVGREDALRQAEPWLNAPDDGESSECPAPGLEAIGLLPLSVPLVSRHAGTPLSDLELGSRWGVQIVEIQRDGETLVSPGRYETLQPGDRLLVLGTADQVSDLAGWLAP